MYLAKYITKTEPSSRFQIDDWHKLNDVQKYFTAYAIGALEVDTILLGFNLSCRSHAIEYLPTDLERRRFVLKRKDQLPPNDESTDIHHPYKWDKYLDRPRELASLTYYELFKYFRYSTVVPHTIPDRHMINIRGHEFPSRVLHEKKAFGSHANVLPFHVGHSSLLRTLRAQSSSICKS